MSKNIVIQEGGVGRQFTADKLTTNLVEGGTCNWVPEDEIQLGTKNITENGTYIAANDGEYGYSQVTVNVSSAEKIITGSTDSGEPVVATVDVIDGRVAEIILGDYFIVTYGEDGKVAKIEDNNGNACTLIYDGEVLSGFDDIEDNRYTIILDSDENISQVIDPNAQECELRDRDNDGKIDIISIGSVVHAVEDIDTGAIKYIDENDNDVTDEYTGTSITGVDMDDTPWRANITSDASTGGASTGITPVTPATTPGASISGVDSDGDKITATIEDDGSITTQKVPTAIVVTNMPTKTIYDEGDTIDYSGMVVKAMLKSGSVFTSDKYPDGVIPISELDLPQIAEIEGDTQEWTDGEINALRITYSEYGTHLGGVNYSSTPLGINTYTNEPITFCGYDIQGGGGFASLFITIYNDYIYAARETGNNPGFDKFGLTSLTNQGYTTWWTILGQWARSPWKKEDNGIVFDRIPESSVAPTTKNPSSLRPVGMNVDVKWANPYDFGALLETNIQLTVNPAEPNSPLL